MRRDRYIEPGSRLTRQRHLGVFPHDPYWPFVTFYTNWWGANGATTAVEQRNHALTFNSGAALDTSQFIFGPSSLRLALTDDTVTAADSPDWSPLAGDFTWEMFVRFNDVTASAGSQVFVCHYNNVGNQRGYRFGITGGNLEFNCTSNGTTTLYTLTGVWAPSNAVWYHVGVERWGGVNSAIWVDNTIIASSAAAGGSIHNSTQALMIGAINSSGVIQEFDGWMGFTRMTMAGRYKGVYVTPTRPGPIG